MQLRENRKINELILVFVGNFNPMIIQPYWLVHKGLIREIEGETAKIEVIHQEIVKFELDWIFLKITRGRLELRCRQEPYFEPLKDLAQGIIQILSETPILSFGINHIRHYTLESDKQYFEFGNKLAPLNIWTDLGEDPRLLSAEFLLKKDEERAIRLRIQPSDVFQEVKNTIMTNINDHYSVSEKVSKVNNTKLLQVLELNWKMSFDYANKVENNIQKIINN